MLQSFLTLAPIAQTPYTTKIFKDSQKRIIGEKQSLMQEYGVDSDTYDRLHRLATQILFVENHWENEENRKMAAVPAVNGSSFSEVFFRSLQNIVEQLAIGS